MLRWFLAVALSLAAGGITAMAGVGPAAGAAGPDDIVARLKAVPDVTFVGEYGAPPAYRLFALTIRLGPGTTDSYWFEVPGGNHNAAIDDLPDEQRATATAAIARWAGVSALRPVRRTAGLDDQPRERGPLR